MLNWVHNFINFNLNGNYYLMEKYIEQIKNGWALLNGRKQESTAPIKIVFAAAVLQALSLFHGGRPSSQFHAERKSVFRRLPRVQYFQRYPFRD